MTNSAHASHGPLVKTSIELPGDLWRAAKVLAAERRTNLRAIIIAALEAYLATRRGSDA